MKSITQVVENLIKPYIDGKDKNIYEVMGENGAKNILPFDLDDIKALNTNGTWAGNVYTYRGVAFTVNSDGTISATGTATGGNASIKTFAASSNYEMLGKEVILNGCPSGGGASTYRIQAYRMASADGSTGTYFDDGAGTDAFTVLNNASGTVGSFAVAVYENTTVTNLLFKPMVRLASDPDDTYQPYAKTNQELTAENQTLTNKVAEESAIRDVLGAKNILPNKLVSGTYYGVSFVNNGDGTITAKGTYSEVNAVLLSNGWSDTDLSWITPFIGKKIRVKCGVVGIDFAIRFYDSDNTNIGQIESGYNGNWGEDTVPSGIHHYAAYLFPRGTITLTDALIFPRVDYAPYSMTNQEMTPYVQAISNPNLLDNPWFTVNQRGFSTQTAQVGYTVDRWRQGAAYGTVTLDSDGCIVLSNASGASNLTFIQNLPSELLTSLKHKTVTLSILFKDGTLVKNTAKNLDFTQNAFYANIGLGTSSGVSLRSPGNNTAFIQLALTPNDTIPAIKAVKLELGSVSTLAQDTAPNYTTELLKCQRYFLRLTQASAGFGICNTAGRMDTLFPIPVAMRALPTATMSGDVGFVCSDGKTKFGMESVSVWGDKPINNIGLFISKTGLTVGLVGRCYITNGSYIDLSADL